MSLRPVPPGVPLTVLQTGAHVWCGTAKGTHMLCLTNCRAMHQGLKPAPSQNRKGHPSAGLILTHAALSVRLRGDCFV